MNRNKLKSFGGDKIISFENFETKAFEGITNRYLIELLETLTSKGIDVCDVEQPEWGTDGMIEISETATISFNTGKSKKMWATLELPNGKFVSTKKTEDLDEALEMLAALKLNNNINEADYSEGSCDLSPRTPTPYLKEQRVERVGKATQMVKNALDELKRTPKIDYTSDIPELIEKLQNILSDKNEHGLINLGKLYKEDK